MAVYNLQALADKTKYLMSTQNMTAQEAEAQVFKEAGISEMDQAAYAEYQKLLTEGTTKSRYSRNDSERLINRRQAPRYETYQDQTEPQPDQQEPPQEPV